MSHVAAVCRHHRAREGRRSPTSATRHHRTGAPGSSQRIGALAPFNSFAEYAPEPNPETKKKDVVWFALNDDRPLAAFGGIWTEFKGDRGTKSKPITGPHNV
jgi:putative SOS response-associated peptidase YedK